MSQRLPIPGQDDGMWGDVLNSFLKVSLNDDGTLNTTAVSDALPTPIPTAHLGTGTTSISKFLRGDGTWAVPSGSTLAGDADVDIDSPTNNQVLTFNTSASKWKNISAVNSIALNGGTAQTGAVSISAVQVAGDIGGTPSSPTVVSSNGADIVTTTGSQNITGAKTFGAGALLDKGSQVFNVKAYGAKGDGTTDDTTAIQAAITAAEAVSVSNTSAAATVYLPAGTYLLTTELLINTSGLSLIGAGFSSTTLHQSSAATNAIHCTSVRNISIKNMTILGPDSGWGNGIYMAASGTTAVFDCTFADLHILHFGGTGFLAEDLCTSVLNHVRVESCLEGFHLGNNGTNSLGGTSITAIACYAVSCANRGYFIDTVNYSTFQGCASDSCGVAYWVSGCSGLSFNGCGAENTVNTSATYPGYGFYPNNGTTSVQFTACFAENLVSTGIGFYVAKNGGANCSRITLSACRVSGSSAPLYSAQVDSTCQATFIGFQQYNGVGYGTLGNSTFLSHENLGISAYGQAPVSGDEPWAAWLSGSTSYAFATSVIADTVKRWHLRADGHMDWGTGADATDTNLYRSGAGSLASDSAFKAQLISATGLTGATAASRYVGATTSGPPTSGTFAVGDHVIAHTGSIWICTGAGSPGTWVVLPTNLNLAAAPTNAIGETCLRDIATGSSSASLSSGAVYVRKIVLPAGQSVNNLTMFTAAGNIVTQGNLTHGWYALLDRNLSVVAVSGDQINVAFLTAINTAYTLPVFAAAGATYKTTYSGLYYIAESVSVSGGNMPQFATSGALGVGVGSAAPIPHGTAGTQAAPPSIGAGLGPATFSNSNAFYGYAS